MALLGNFIGGALGLQSGESYTQSVEAANRLQELQRKNQARKNQLAYGVDTEMRGGTAGVKPLAAPEPFDFDTLQQPGLKNIPVVPPAMVDQEGGVADGVPPAGEEVKPPVTQTKPSVTETKPSELTIPKFDSSKTVIDPKTNQNVPNAPNQITKPKYQGLRWKLLPDGVEDENDVSDEDKQSLHVQGFPWKVVTKNGGQIVVHNGVEYDIVDITGDGSSFQIVDRFGRPNFPLTDAFTKARSRGITNTEITPRDTSEQIDLGAAAVDNSFIANALKTIEENKFQNGVTNTTTALARQFGIDEGEALALLAIESNFGTVKYDSRSSTRGPLQIQNLAFKDVKTYYSGAKPAGVNMSDAEWARLVQVAAALPKNHSNLTGTKDQIAAGLLYYKMIGLKGVAPEFRAAAYYDGYGKYIGIDSIADVKSFSGPNTLESVLKYNSAFLNMKGYMGEVANYYYPSGGALPGQSTTTQGNTVGQTVPSETQTQAQTQTQTQTQTAPVQTQTQTSTSVETMPAPTKFDGGFEIRMEDGPVVYKDGKPVTRFMESTPEGSMQAAEAYIAEQLGQTVVTPNITIAGKEEKSAANEGVDPDITKFLKDPPAIGIEMKNIMRARELEQQLLQRRIDEANAQIEANNRKVQEYERMAQVARISGDLDGYTRYRGLADTVNAQSVQLRNAARVAVDEGRVKMLGYDNKILLAQGAQALQDLTYGSTARAGAVLSAYSGLDIKVQPRSDGKFDIVVQGEVQATYTMNQLSDKLQSAFSQAYRDQKQKDAAKRQTYLFEKNVDLQVELAKERQKLISTIKEKTLQGKIDAYLKSIENAKGEFKTLNNGMAVIFDGQNYFLLNPEAIVTDPETQEKSKQPRLFPLDMAQAQALASGVGSAEAFKNAAK